MKINENKIKKFTLLAAILAPMIYLFGSLFATLQGAHGNIVLADEKTATSVVLDNVFDNSVTTSYNVGDTFALTPDSRYFVVDVGQLPTGDYSLNCSLNSNGEYRILGVSEGVISFVQQVWVDSYLFQPNPDYSYYLRCYKSYFLDRTFTLSFNDGDLYRYFDKISYTDFLFSQFFAKNNFLAASGEKVINGTPDYGFAPAADMIRYIDSNMLHLANLEWGYLVIGYVYYAFHVTIVFLMFELLMFFPHLIENVYERFERGW